MFCAVESIESRSLVDATDFSANDFNGNYPPLQPTPKSKTRIMSSNTPPSNHDSFRIAPSLSTLNDTSESGNEHGYADPLDIRPIRAKFIDPNRKIEAAGYALCVPTLLERDFASSGHVLAREDGSPSLRKRAFTLHTARGRDALCEKANNRSEGTGAWCVNMDNKPTDVEVKIAEIGLKETLMGIVDETPILVEKREDSCEDMTGDNECPSDFGEDTNEENPDSALRRSTRCGTGPMLRFSKDADEVIMGIGYAYSKKVPGFRTPVDSLTPKSSELRVSSSNQLSRSGVHRKASVMRDDSSRLTPVDRPKKTLIFRTSGTVNKLSGEPSMTYAARKSSLPNSPEYIPFNSKSPKLALTPSTFAERLSRPTRASQCRASESKVHLAGRSKATLSVSTPAIPKALSPAPSSNTANLGVGSTLPVARRSSQSVKPPKGLKDRFSAILTGRRRFSESKNTLLRVPTASDNEGRRGSLVKTDMKTLETTIDREAYRYKAFKNNGMANSAINDVETGADGELHKNEVTDNTMAVAADAHQAAASLDQTDPKRAKMSFVRSLYHLSAPQHPLTPPQSSGGSAISYSEGEDEQQDSQPQNEIDRAIRDSKENFDIILARMPLVSDVGMKTTLENVLVPLAAAIKATVVARRASVRLEAAIADLVILTANMGVNAGQMTIDAQPYTAQLDVANRGGTVPIPSTSAAASVPQTV